MKHHAKKNDVTFVSISLHLTAVPLSYVNDLANSCEKIVGESCLLHNQMGRNAWYTRVANFSIELRLYLPRNRVLNVT